MKKYLFIVTFIILGLFSYGAYWYFTQPRISFKNISGQSITFSYSNLSSNMLLALVDTSDNFWTLQWKPESNSGTANVIPSRGTPLGTYYLRVTNADGTKILAKSESFSIGDAGNPTASIDQQSLIASSNTPTISGNSNTYNIGVFVETAGRQVYAEEADVINGKWAATLPQVADGNYTVKIYDESMNLLLTSGTLVVATN